MLGEERIIRQLKIAVVCGAKPKVCDESAKLDLGDSERPEIRDVSDIYRCQSRSKTNETSSGGDVYAGSRVGYALSGGK